MAGPGRHWNVRFAKRISSNIKEMKHLLYGWNVMRVLRLVMGGIAIWQSIALREWLRYPARQKAFTAGKGRPPDHK